MIKDRQWSAKLEDIRSDHLNRYRFAASTINGRVLDAACGCGYGASILHAEGMDVCGIDVSRETIDFAEKHYHGPGYTCGDILDKPWLGRFDWIVCFETLEHLAQPLKALRLFREAGENLLISVPNEALYPFDAAHFKDDDYPHLRHYTEFELEDILGKADWLTQAMFCQKDKQGEVVEGCDGKFLIFRCS